MRRVCLDETFVPAGNHENGRAIVVRLVNRHCGVLDSDRAVQQSNHRFAFSVGVTVSHCHGGFFMKSGDEFRHPVRRISIVDERLLQAFETRSGISGDIFEPHIFQHLHHEIGPRPLDCPHGRRRPDHSGVPCDLLLRGRRYRRSGVATTLSLGRGRICNQRCRTCSSACCGAL